MLGQWCSTLRSLESSAEIEHWKKWDRRRTDSRQCTTSKLAEAPHGRLRKAKWCVSLVHPSKALHSCTSPEALRSIDFGTGGRETRCLLQIPTPTKARSLLECHSLAPTLDRVQECCWSGHQRSRAFHHHSSQLRSDAVDPGKNDRMSETAPPHRSRNPYRSLRVRAKVGLV